MWCASQICTVTSNAQTPARDYKADMQRAMDMAHQGRYVDARAILADAVSDAEKQAPIWGGLTAE